MIKFDPKHAVRKTMLAVAVSLAIPQRLHWKMLLIRSFSIWPPIYNRVWPLGALAIVFTVTLAWIGLLGFGIFEVGEILF
jgi:hypothetical protein